MAKPKITISTSGLIAIIVVGFVVTAFMGINPYWKPTLGTTSPGSGAVSGAIYCQGVGLVSPPYPSNCATQQVKLQITLQNLLGGSLTASKYSVKYWQNVGSPATFQAPTPSTGPLIIGGSWVILDQQKAGAAPTSATTANGWSSGTQIAIQVCENQTPTCAAGDYTAKEVNYLCPLPSLAPTTTGSALQTVCGYGPGAGTIPLVAQSQNPPVTINFNLPIPVSPGSLDDGFNTNSPNCAQWGWANGTLVPAAPCSAAGAATGFTLNCTTGAPCIGMGGTTGTSGLTGRFVASLNLGTGNAGTNTYANGYPATIACMTYNPVDPSLQSGPTARGTLQCVLALEIKATTGTDMCFAGPWAGITPTVVSKSGTDVFYIYPLPDSATLLAKDAAGTIYSPGTIGGSISLDCSAVKTGGSTDVVTLTFNEYQYFSMAYFKYNVGSLNPEVPINSSSGLALNDVLTIKQ